VLLVASGEELGVGMSCLQVVEASCVSIALVGEEHSGGGRLVLAASDQLFAWWKEM